MVWGGENGEKRHFSVSYLQPPACIFLFFNFLLPSSCFTNPNMLVFDLLGIRLTNQLSFCLAPFQFNSLWFVLIWCKLQLALHRNGWRETFHFYTLSTFSDSVLSYSYLNLSFCSTPACKWKKGIPLCFFSLTLIINMGQQSGHLTNCYHLLTAHHNITESHRLNGAVSFISVDHFLSCG